MITICHLGISQSDRIVWLMEELGLPYRLQAFTRHSSGYAPDELKAVHPLGRAPVIRDEGVVLAESGAIVEYICHRYANGRLWVRPDAPNYADFLFWLHTAPGTLSPMSMYRMFAHRADHRDLDHIMVHFLEQFDILLGMLDAQLGRHPFVGGEDLTAADIMIAYPLTTWTRYNGLDLTPYPNIRAYVRRIEARPAYIRTMDIAGPDRGAGLPAQYTLADPRA
ncbi:MAG: glutathione S-transferase family protein [Sphingobium sp.]